MSSKTLVISNICNNGCRICYVDFSKIYPIRDRFFKSQSNARAQTSVETVCLTGGEPTLNKDIFRLLLRIRRFYPSAEISLLTNGRLFAYSNFTQHFFSLKLGRFKFIIPIHGPDADLHDTTTGVSGSFNQTIEGIGNILRHQALLEIRVIIHKLNYKFLKDISEFVKNKFPQAAYLVFLMMEIGLQAVSHDLPVRYSDIRPYLEKALRVKFNFTKVKLFHFPLCVVNNNCRSLVYASIEKNKLSTPTQCVTCLLSHGCQGVLKTYLSHFGSREFQPVNRRHG